MHLKTIILSVIVKMCFLLSLFLISCSNKLEENAKKAFSEKKYQKAFVLYKQAIQKKPTKQELYDSLEKTVSAILHKGIELIKEGNYEKAIQTFSSIAKDKKYAMVDAKTATGIAYIQSYLHSHRNIQQGLLHLMDALLQAQEKIPIGLSPKLLQWITEQGFDKKDVLMARLGNKHDSGAVYRTKLFYDLAHSIKTTNNLLIPNAISETEEKAFEKLYALFSWCIHSIHNIEEKSPYYFPASIASVIVRGYGTVEEQTLSFLFLCQQIGFPCYLLETIKSDYYALVKIKNNWLFFDFKTKKLVAKKEILSFSLKENLRRVGADTNGTIWLTFPARNIIPRMSLIPKCYDSLQFDSPYFFYSIQTMASIVSKDLGKKFLANEIEKLFQKQKELSVAIYPKQIQIWSKYNNSKDKNTAKKWREKDPLDALSKKMVLFSLLKEKEKVDTIMKEISKPKNSEFFAYYKACALVNFEPKEAEKAFLKYLELYPKGFWQSACHMKLAYMYSKTDLVKSREYYEKSASSNVMNWMLK